MVTASLPIATSLEASTPTSARGFFLFESAEAGEEEWRERGATKSGTGDQKTKIKKQNNINTKEIQILLPHITVIVFALPLCTPIMCACYERGCFLENVIGVNFWAVLKPEPQERKAREKEKEFNIGS